MADIEELFERLALWLASLAMDRARKGLHRDFTSRQDRLQIVRGRLQPLATTLSFWRGRLDLHCRYTEPTVDIADNRIVVWTLHWLRHHRFAHREVRDRVAAADRALAPAVTLQRFRSSEISERARPHHLRDYSTMHGLCRLLLTSTGADLAHGEASGVPFLVDMPRLYEAFVARRLAHALAGRLLVQPQVSARIAGDTNLRFQIDLVVREPATGRVVAVLDTKWKDFQSPAVGDVQQLVAYAVRIKRRLGMGSWSTRRSSLPHGRCASETCRSMSCRSALVGRRSKRIGTWSSIWNSSPWLMAATA